MTLKVAVIGAHGRVGQLVCDKLRDNEAFTPLAVVRSQEQADFFESKGIVASLKDIESSSVAQIADLVRDCDAVVWVAGAGGKGVERIFTVDLDGAIKTVEACEQACVRRFVMLSAINAESRENWYGTALRNYYIAKRTADYVVRHSHLDYTIWQPGSLINASGTGRVCALDEIGEKRSVHYEITREDVAEVIVQGLLYPQTCLKQTVPLANGALPIETFLRSLKERDAGAAIAGGD
ncbi:LAMI_0A04830g1_1 [Lachancea mirantina]|uniref:LAMI_0A04830g1_1 n=1 Tax=Lachancea mirantina TaxID=1230905 RepID=A0A1G4IPB3_9SACH|nr:LAMI_0A04830g1_1 [Lachancea mirantina]